MPRREVALPTGVKEEDLLPNRYETFTMDRDWVHRVNSHLLGLEVGTAPSKDINTSERFVPQAAASELEPPEVIVDHWLPILREHSHLTECHPDQFTAVVDWVPLYTLEGPEKHLPAALSTFVNTGPPNLSRLTSSNENSETTLSHVRKHLNLLFVCGGCYSKSFPHGLALNKHMRTQCHSVTAIREKTRASRK